jgi:hypothetical protein
LIQLNVIQILKIGKIPSGQLAYGIRKLAVFRGGSGIVTTACEAGNTVKAN